VLLISVMAAGHFGPACAPQQVPAMVRLCEPWGSDDDVRPWLQAALGAARAATGDGPFLQLAGAALAEESAGRGRPEHQARLQALRENGFEALLSPARPQQGLW
jgi:hypothetical protein